MATTDSTFIKIEDGLELHRKFNGNIRIKDAISIEVGFDQWYQVPGSDKKLDFKIFTYDNAEERVAYWNATLGPTIEGAINSALQTLVMYKGKYWNGDIPEPLQEIPEENA